MSDLAKMVGIVKAGFCLEGSCIEIVYQFELNKLGSVADGEKIGPHNCLIFHHGLALQTMADGSQYYATIHSPGRFNCVKHGH